MVLVCVRQSGSWAIHCIAARLLTKSTVHILPTTMLTCGKIYKVTQTGYILVLDLSMERFFIVGLLEVVELDQYTGNLVHCWGRTLSSTSSMWMGGAGSTSGSIG